MSDFLNPKLTIGTFFTLLTSSMKVGIKSTKADYLVFNDFVEIIEKNDFIESSAIQQASRLKNCSIRSTIIFPFTYDYYIEKLEELFKNQYDIYLQKISLIIADNFPTNHDSINALGRSLLELIYRDTSISDNDVFYIKNNLTPIKKKDLKNNIKYEIQPLIAGVWYYIISNKIDNKLGSSTISNWNLNTIEHGQFNMAINSFINSFKDTTILYIHNDDTRLHNNSIPQFEGTFCISNYLAKLNNRFNSKRTLLYKNEDKHFYDFYVCNDLTLATEYNFPNFDINYNYVDINNKRRFCNSTIKSLLNDFGTKVIITGIGGLGKSMMMQHFLLDSISKFDEYKLIPVFVPLKSFRNDISFEEFILSNITEHEDMTYNQFISLLSDGSFVFLMDGLDEIHSNLFNIFDDLLDKFCNKYSGCSFVLSTRPHKSCISKNKYKVLNIMPFTKSQALTLISKLEFGDNEDVKNDFIIKFKDEFFDYHKDFATNPLLLTIMIITFCFHKKISKEYHQFYSDAYEALVFKHNESKGHERQDYTNLNFDEFKLLFAEFCFRTYHKEKFEFTYDEGLEIFEYIQKRKGITYNFSFMDFLKELTENLCLILDESNRYFFAHRSFQEYFCAFYYSKQKDESLFKIGLQYESTIHRHNTDNTLSFLYSMCPSRVEEFIFMPYINKILSECEKTDGFWHFMKNYYSEINFGFGNITDNDIYVHSDSYLLDFILKLNGVEVPLDVSDYFNNYDVDILENYITFDFYEVTTGQNKKGEPVTKIVRSDDMDEYDQDEASYIGSHYVIYSNQIIEEKENNTDIIKIIESTSSPLMALYSLISKILNDYENKYINKDEADLYDLI